MSRPLVFDCGDTLLGLEPSRETLFVEAVSGLGLELPSVHVKRAYDIVEYANRQMASELKHAGSKRDYARRFNHALARVLGLESQKDEIDEVVYAQFRSKRRWTANPGAVEALARLKDHPLYVLANWDSNLADVLAQAGLLDFFENVHASADLGAEKPSMEVFEQFGKRAKIDLQTACYTGNEYVADVVGARAAGMTPILLDLAGHYSEVVDCAYAANWVAVPDVVLSLGLANA